MTKHDLFNQPRSIRSLLFSLTKMEHAPRPTRSKNIGTKSAPKRWWNRHCQKGSPEMVQRALIVEDEPLIAIDLEATLRTLGFDVCGTRLKSKGSCRACNKPPARFYLDGRLSRRGPPGDKCG